MSAPATPNPLAGTIETAQEDIRNALAVLELAAVKLPTDLVNLALADYEAVRARLHRAYAKLESEARK